MGSGGYLVLLLDPGLGLVTLQVVVLDSQCRDQALLLLVHQVSELAPPEEEQKHSSPIGICSGQRNSLGRENRHIFYFFMLFKSTKRHEELNIFTQHFLKVLDLKCQKKNQIYFLTT